MINGILKEGMTLPVSAITLEKHITDGGDAEIWEVTQRGLIPQLLVAKLVVIPVDATESDKNRVQRLMDQEAKIWSKIAFCPHIVPMLGQVQEPITVEDKEYYVLGFLTHRAECDLGRALKGKEMQSMGAKAMLEFLLQLAEGLKTAHDYSIAHMDVKPENVLLFKLGTGYYARWTDFGVSISSDFAADLFGTPKYMAPERFQKGKQFSITEYMRADVFSLGVVFYEIIAGRHPFVGDEKPTDSISEEFWRDAVERKEPDFEILRERGLVGINKMLGDMLRKTGYRADMPLVIAHLKHALEELFIEEYSVRQKTLVLSEGIYRWNPNVHRMLGSTLHYYMVDCEQQVHLEWIKSNLQQSGIHGYACYIVLGEFDYVFRIWVKRAYLKPLEDIWTRFTATYGGRVRKLIVDDLDVFYGSRTLEQTNEDELLSAIANTTELERTQQEKTLINLGLVMAPLHVKVKGTRLFIGFRSKQLIHYQRKLISNDIKQLLSNQDLGYKCNELSIYQGEGDYGVLVKFRLEEFGQYAAILESLLTIAEEARKSGINIDIESYVEVFLKQTVESDDGSILHEVTKFKREPR